MFVDMIPDDSFYLSVLPNMARPTPLNVRVMDRWDDYGRSCNPQEGDVEELSYARWSVKLCY